jgi:dihydroxyacid dehydratase/phosphogluconate dehydratase
MAPPRKKKLTELRSQRWFGRDDLRSFGHRSRTKQAGFTPEDFEGKPVVAILNTWSEANSCHLHLRTRADEVKRGVWQAGGFPLEMPVLSLGETYMKPSAMLYRNLLAMETEEILRSNPVDGAVLLGGCDKTVPALVMGPPARTSRLSSSQPVRCSAETGAVRPSAAAATCGSTGRRNAPASSATVSGERWRTASPARTGRA